MTRTREENAEDLARENRQASVPVDVVIQALELIRNHDFAAEADAGFDAGEFSGPAHDRMMEQELNTLLAPFGLTADDAYYFGYWPGAHEQRVAVNQGWDLFTNDDGETQIQRLDDPPAHHLWEGSENTGPLFGSDELAVAHVRARAAAGDGAAKLALYFHEGRK